MNQFIIMRRRSVLTPDGDKHRFRQLPKGKIGFPIFSWDSEAEARAWADANLTASEFRGIEVIALVNLTGKPFQFV